jgi:iron complex outermembrane receptor protein
MPARPHLTFLVLLMLAATVGAEPDPVATAPEAPVLVVTARKRAEPELEVPQSLTVIREETLRDAGIRGVAEAARYVPNASFVEFTARRLSFPFVRGIGSGQGEPAVATYLDGVPLLGEGATNLPLLDVERIEFLRGPQGTLYGRNSLGGLVHVFTRPAPPRPEVRAVATMGNHGLLDTSLVLGGPILENRLSFGLGGLVFRRDGYTRNDFTGNDVDHRDTFFVQGQLRFTPDDRNELRLGLVAERSRDGGFALSDLDGLRDRPHRISQDFEGVAERDVGLASLTWRHRGEVVDLVSITSFQGFDVLETSDFDFSELDGVRRRTEERRNAFVQELRVASPTDAPVLLGDDVELAWLVGAVGFLSDSDRSAANEFRPGGVGIISPVAGVDESSGEFEDRGIGLFGQATLTLFGDLQIGAGLRFDRESKDAKVRRTFTSQGVPLSDDSRKLDETFDEVLPRFDVGYRVSEEVRFYGYAAKGFVAGGFNLTAPEGALAYGPETSWTYEAGVKTSLLEGRLRLDAALFWIDWDDMQLSQFDASAGGYVTNAGEATSRGIEVAVTGRPIEGLDLFGSFGWTDSEFGSYVDPYGEDAKGNRLPFAPETTLHLGAQWAGQVADDVRLRVRGEFAHYGTFYYDAGNREGESFGVASFRVGVGGESWRLDAWIRNAFDESYVPVAFQPNPADPSAFVGESGAPRTFGCTLGLRF